MFAPENWALQRTQQQHEEANQNSSSDLILELATLGTTVRCVNFKAIKATDNEQLSQAISCFKVMHQRINKQDLNLRPTPSIKSYYRLYCIMHE